MKKFLAVIFLSIAFQTTNAQLVSATGAVTGSNKITVYGKTTVSFSDRIMDNIIITISFVDQGASNPTVTISNNYLPILSWSQVSNYASGGRIYYVFTGTSTPTATTPTTSWTAGTSNPIIDMKFSNSNAFGTLQLNDQTGDPTGEAAQAYWYFQMRVLGDATNYAQKFYGSGAVNNLATPSYVPFQAQAPAPVSFKDFNVAKQGTGNALLTWTTTFEQNSSHFIIERSTKESNNWNAIAQVKAKGNSFIDVKYEYTDLNVYDGRQVSKTVYYRLREVDLDATEKIFPVRSLRFSALGDKDITVFPNPAKDGFYVLVPLTLRNDRKIRLNLTNRLGQIVDSREISTAVANNYYYELSSAGIVTGDYVLDIIYDSQKLATKKIMISK